MILTGIIRPGTGQTADAGRVRHRPSTNIRRAIHFDSVRVEDTQKQHAILTTIALAACAGGSTTTVRLDTDTTFAGPFAVTITGYVDHAMEPFITRDGQYLLFNNRNDPAALTDLQSPRG